MPRMNPRVMDENGATSPIRKEDTSTRIRAWKAPPFHVETFEKLDDELFLVRGVAKQGRFSKPKRQNMIVQRHNKRELTLINPFRLEDEAMLLSHGRVERLVRLSPHTDPDHDRYYLDRFPHCRRWAPPGKNDPAADALPVHRYLTDSDDAILPNYHVFSFQNTARPEIALLILQDYVGNLLVTGDCLVPGRKAKITIPQQWLQPIKRKDRHRLRVDFERLLRLDFARLVGSRGDMLYVQAKEATVLAVEKSFPVF